MTKYFTKEYIKECEAIWLLKLKELIEKNKSAPTPTWWNPEVEQLQSAIKLLKESEDK